MANSRRSIAVVLRAEVAAYKRDMASAAVATASVAEAAEKSGTRAQGALGRLQDRISASSTELSSLATGAGVAGTAMVAFAGLSVSKFAQFDQAMSSVRAATMETAENMGLLREAALSAGADTAYSATEAAAAIEELAKAGVSTQDILSGGLSGALDLAASDTIAVADAAQIAATALSQFQLAGSETTHVADLLAAGAASAQGGVAELGQALNQSGLVASQFGLDIDTTVGSLSAFASAGLLGSDAGTSLKAMLIALANPSRESSELMAELGINAYDAAGNFVGMANLAGQLHAQLGDLTQAQRNQALAQIFGNDAIRAANVLFEEGEQGIESWIDRVDQTGFAATQAGIQLDNLTGDIEALRGAFDNLMIGLGEGGNAPLRDLVQGLTGVINSFNGMSESAQHATLAIIGGTGLALLGVGGMLKLTIAIAETKAALVALGATSDVAKSRLGSLAAATGKVAAGAGAVMLLAKALDAAATASYRVETSTVLMTNALRGVGGDSIDDVFAMTTGIDSLADSFTKLTGTDATNSINRWASETFGFLNLTDDVKNARDQFDALGVTLSQMSADEAAEQFENLVTALGGSAEVREQLLALMPAYRDALAQEQGAAAGAATGQNGLTASYDGATGAIETQTDALMANIDAQREAAGIILDAREAARDYEAALDTAAAAIEESTEAGIALADMLDIGTEAGRRNESALDGITDAAWANVDSLRATGATQDELQASMQRSRDDFIAMATSMGLSADEAAALADKLGLIPTSIQTNVAVSTSAAQLTLDQFLAQNRSRTIRINTIIDNGGNTGGGYAVGGAVRGPGTATSDSVLARLSNGEHVLTAADVARMGGQSGVYAFRSMLHRGLAGFATGGAVGATKLELLRAEQRIRDLERSLRETEKVKGGGTRQVLRGLDRQVAQAELAEAKQDLRDLKAQGRQARSDAARERARERASLTGDLRTDLRRGDIRQQVASGGGLSVVDDMLSWASNASLTSGARTRLKTTAARAEKTLTSLYKRLDSAQETLADIEQVYRSVRDGLGGEFDLGGSLSPTWSISGNSLAGYDAVSTKASGSSIAASAQATADRIRTFAGKLTALRKAGASEALLTEVAALGSEQGIVAADALLADRGSIKAANSAYSDIAKYSQQAGLAVAQGMSGASGLNLKVAGGELGSGLVDKLNSQIGSVGEGLAAGFASALGYKLNKSGTGLVKKAEGGEVWGAGTATSDSIPALLSNGEFVMKAAAHQKYGTTFMREVNAGRYARGGHVGSLVSASPNVVVSLNGEGASRTFAPVINSYTTPVTPSTVVTAMRLAEFQDPGVPA